MKDMSVEDLIVLYEDNHIIVAEKPPNIPSQADKTEETDRASGFTTHLFTTGYIGVSHRRLCSYRLCA